MLQIKKIRSYYLIYSKSYLVKKKRMQTQVKLLATEKTQDLQEHEIELNVIFIHGVNFTYWQLSNSNEQRRFNRNKTKQVVS